MTQSTDAAFPDALTHSIKKNKLHFFNNEVVHNWTICRSSDDVIYVKSVVSIEPFWQ